tara:strand:+ start:10663 stop:11763 length:1101 start_codon:yes stop_codon:yes gene_type:complete
LFQQTTISVSLSHETILYVDLKALEHNFYYLKSKLDTKTEIIAVVKAFAYGHGDIAIAKELEKLGVDAFWVADFEEGVNLRKSGITLPIIVANPGVKSYSKIIKYNLEPVIYNMRLLELFGNKKSPLPVHIKFNTGMNRYGFNAEEIDDLSKKLTAFPQLIIKSICSHLAAADDKKKDAFTHNQIEKFNGVCDAFYEKLNINPKRHILNTAGALRFTKAQNQMVRLGIGLYGIGDDKDLMPVGKLVSNLAQIRSLQIGDSVGYDTSFVAEKKMKIAIIPLGYADGINRKLGDGKGKVLINNSTAKIIGKISMDSFMVDISAVDATEGDEVIVFGKENSVAEIAKKIDTIAYEILATLNRRIKRIYH